MGKGETLMMKRTFRRAGGMALKMKNKNNLREMAKNVAKTAGKLTPGGAIVGTLKDIRDRKSILNKRTPIKKDTRPNRDTSYLKEKAKEGRLYRLDQAPKGEAKKPLRRLKTEVQKSRSLRLDKSTIEKMNKARDNYYKKNTKRRQYLGNKKG